MFRSFSFKRALLAGSLATVVMTILMYGMPLLGLPRMDIMAALGGVFPAGTSPYLLGSIVHLFIGIALGLIYAVFFASWLPGPGWFKGAVFSLLPWLFAITLLGPTLVVASEFFRGQETIVVNPCSVVSNPCAVRPANPCSVRVTPNPCVSRPSNPCGTQNPCGMANPCAAPNASSAGPSPEVMSLVAHLLFGAALGIGYRPKSA